MTSPSTSNSTDTDRAAGLAPPEVSRESSPNQPVPIHLDTAQTHACYANFCRVTGTPEELIIDFGLNTQPMGVASEPIQVSERIVINYYTAKRMLAALQISLQRHESAFGNLETNVHKRVLPGLQPSAQR